MSHDVTTLAFNLAIEHATFPILTTVKILKNNIQTMRCETSAQHNLSQRPPPDRR